MASRDKNKYFIVTATPAPHGWIKPGQIFYISEERYLRATKQKKNTIPLIRVDSVLDRDLPVEVLLPLTRKQAELLLALNSDEEKLREYTHSVNLEQALDLVEGSEVMVENCGEWLKGVVRYIGRRSEPVPGPVAGVFFGVELQVGVFSAFAYI